MRHTIREQDALQIAGAPLLEKSGSIPFQRKLVVSVLACATVGLNSCKQYSDSHREPSPHINQEVIEEKRNASTLPACPDAPYAKLNAKQPATGHHRVFLTWNASLSASGSDTKGVGYCLYRTQTAGKAKDCPNEYAKCEQVNVIPVRGTRCVDELVKDNTTYYYGAIAITSTGTSTSSEEAIAEYRQRGNQIRLLRLQIHILHAEQQRAQIIRTDASSSKRD